MNYFKVEYFQEELEMFEGIVTGVAGSVVFLILTFAVK